MTTLANERFRHRRQRSRGVGRAELRPVIAMVRTSAWAASPIDLEKHGEEDEQTNPWRKTSARYSREPIARARRH